MTSAHQLKHYCDLHNIPLTGVYCANDAPMKLDGSLHCILNHSDCQDPGTHWLGCTIVDEGDAGKVAIWFDSYGLPPDNPLENRAMNHDVDDPHFLKWFQDLGVTDVRYNEHRLQSDFSDVCGLYSVYFLKYGLPFTPAGVPRPGWEWVGPDPRANDAMIQNLVPIKTSRT